LPPPVMIHVLLGGRLLGERPGQHEFGLEDGASGLDQAIQGCGHPWNQAMEDPALDAGDDVIGIALIPAAIEVFGGEAKLDDQLAGQVSGFDIASFLSPQSLEGLFVLTHDHAGIRTPDEQSAIFDRFRSRM
jgi:hypothetical protein